MATTQVLVVSVAAATTTNVLQGYRIGKIDPRYGTATVRIAAQVEAASLSLAAYVGSDNPIFPTVPNVSSTFATVNMRDDIVGAFRVRGGDELTLDVTNAHASTAYSIRLMIEIS
jgi:hypothetical protein